MRTLNFREILKEFDVLFVTTQKTMFKAEVLQDYSAVDDGPSLRAWLDGDTEKSKQLARKDTGITDWRQKCLASPATITRVHVADEPFTDYLKWEIEVIYKDSLLRGDAEQVLLAPRAKLRDIQLLPAGDFWIFDGITVLQWEYENDHGKLTGGKIWESGEDISYFLDLQHRLLTIAQPVLKTAM